VIDVIDFTPCRRLDIAIARCATDPDAQGFLELLRAVRAGRISLTAILNRRAVWTPRSIKSRLPVVILISDDNGDSRDPCEWRCSISAIAWSKCALIHGTGGERWHYAEAIKAAQLTGRCLLVETDSSHVAAWSASIAPRQIPMLHIIPPAGCHHPVDAQA
jgi:hypothetical protein